MSSQALGDCRRLQAGGPQLPDHGGEVVEHDESRAVDGSQHQPIAQPKGLDPGVGSDQEAQASDESRATMSGVVYTVIFPNRSSA